MDELHPLRCLVAAVDAGSFTGAAKTLGVSQPAVSQKVKSLELAYGQTLLIRNRAGVQPTMAGQVAYGFGQKIGQALDEMRVELDSLQGTISGHIRITAGQSLSQTYLGEVVIALKAQHRDLKVDLVISDALIDLEKDNVDFAIRFGSPGQGRGIGRKIGVVQSVLAATPAYLDRAGRPHSPRELQNLDFIQYRDDTEQAMVAVTYEGQNLSVPVTPSLTADHPNLIAHALEKGLGFTKAPLYFVQNFLDSGVYEEVLPGCRPVPKPLYLVQREEVHNTARAKLFQEVLIEKLATAPGISISPDLRRMG
ncbi:LysR family transcriptional regulator [Maritalea mobilis]|uniref:LysR family transcriptional regulator n=1 Tax=Maritalea mobilis TaxID=483324 RepID=A0A4R6VES1_9HYPH|nr:LysR family transcriptional regulator [Maritalea mobilis]TDQ61474.1 LysR family transcriptional regulator [Maritalea mobilis]